MKFLAATAFLFGISLLASAYAQSQLNWSLTAIVAPPEYDHAYPM